MRLGMETCPYCEGGGYASPHHKCKNCDGTGLIYYPPSQEQRETRRRAFSAAAVKDAE